MNPKQTLEKNTILVNPNSNERYVIRKLIATGGFSFIYEADMVFYTHSPHIGEREVSRDVVVLKELFYPEKAKRQPDSTQVQWEDEDDPNAISKRIKSKTLSEASKLSSLQSKYILHIYSVFELNNTVYIATRQIKNATDFHNYLSLGNTPKKLSISEALKYFAQICEALREVHEKNIVHLDIKPENILIDNNGDTTLIDFGISVSLKDGKPATLLGAATPHYAPPEQSSRESRINFSTDIYALGCTLYVFLTGNLVPNHADLVSGSENVPAPSYFNEAVSPYLDEVILKSISLRMSDRYQTVNQFLDAINGEEVYNKIIEAAKGEFANKEYETAIKTLDKAIEFIPPTEEVQNLMAGIRSEYQKAIEKEELDGKVSQIDSLLEKGEFQPALAILKTLTPSAEIENKIRLAEEGERKKAILNLRKKAQAYVDADKLKEAISIYQEIKILSPPDNVELNDKINNLIEEDNYRNHLIQGGQYLQNQDFEAAFLEFSNALKIKPEDKELTGKIESCQQLIIKQKEYEDALEKVKRFEVLPSLSNEQLAELEEIAQNYVEEEYFQQVWRAKMDQNFRNKGILEYQNQNYSESEKLFGQIRDKTSSDRDYLVVIANHKDLQVAKELVEKEKYGDAINLLQKIADNSPLYSESREILYQALFLQGKVHHNAGNFNESEVIFGQIPEGAKEYTNGQQFLQFYQGKRAFESKEFTNASSIFNKISLGDLKEEVSVYQDKVHKEKQKTILIDESLIREVQELIQKRDWENALSKLHTIRSDSPQITTVQTLIRDIKLRIKNETENKYVQHLNEAKQKINQKQLNEAKELLLIIPYQSESYAEAQQLLKAITKKPISTGEMVVGVCVLIFIGILLLAYFPNKKTHTEPEEEAIAVEELLDSTAVAEVDIPVTQAEVSANQSSPKEESQKPDLKTTTQTATKQEEDRRAREQKAEQERIAKENEKKRLEEANKAEYAIKLKWAKAMMDKYGVSTCKENSNCKEDVISNLKKALEYYPQGREARELLNQMQN